MLKEVDIHTSIEHGLGHDTIVMIGCQAIGMLCKGAKSPVLSNKPLEVEGIGPKICMAPLQPVHKHQESREVTLIAIHQHFRGQQGS